MRRVQEEIEKTQRQPILDATRDIVDRLESGAAWHIMDTGHMLMYESVGRTGGMVALKPIKITCEIDNPVRFRPSPSRKMFGYDSIHGFTDYVLCKSNIMPQDIITIGSVSGYNFFPVDLAIRANEMGCLTIAITSVRYSEKLESNHPSAKRLFEVCSHCLDNCTTYGDTLVDVPELGQGICPASGIGASYLIWALQSSVVEAMLAKSLRPGVYVSNHMPGAAEANKRALEQYVDKGY